MQRAQSAWLLNVSALAVHLYTASGAVLAFLIVMAAIQGNAVQALWFVLIAMIIDGTDGMLARRFRVGERIPWFDGALLDNIVDYLTYVFAPVLLLWTAGSLPVGPLGLVVAALPLLASTYQFCRVDAKTEDHFFLGFPSYWNIIAFYAIVLAWSPATTAAVLVVCAILAFVPIRYVYPSRTLAFRRVTMSFSALWLIAYALILLQMPTPSPSILFLSYVYAAYYLLLSLYLNFRRPAVVRSEKPDAAA